ncbi:MAG: hypothetical protein OCU18_07100 [Candidatus Syntrophoarchaeum sp.]|nr:hypothetical protein [Candidatus Syntrophoarchaeum sp.]
MEALTFIVAIATIAILHTLVPDHCFLEERSHPRMREEQISLQEL